MAARAEDLLPVEYFHVVFTLPAEIARIAYWNKREVYGLLFKVSAETVTTIAADPRHLGARLGMIERAPHLGLGTYAPSACPHDRARRRPVAGGSRWIACRPGFFLPVRVLSRLFRRLFLEGLVALHKAGGLRFFGELEGLADPAVFAAWLAPLRKTEWVVYAKPPFGGPEAVLTYLSRYTHRVAISNHRLVSADAETVAFRWKDYRIKTGDRQKVMRLATDEFIRRFLIHVLPDGFHRIRHYGLLAGATRPARAVSVLRRTDAHRRDFPPRRETIIPRPAMGAGRMTNRPSVSRYLTRFPFEFRTASGLPDTMIGSQTSGHRRRPRSENTLAGNQDASGCRRPQSDGRPNTSVAGTLSALFP